MVITHWHDIRNERHTQPGEYLTVCPNPTYDDPYMSVAEWFCEGDVMTLDAPPGRGEAHMLEVVFSDRYRFHVPRAGFWTQGGGKAWEFSAITHWAHLPNAPEGYMKEDV